MLYEDIQRLAGLTNKYVWFLFSGIILFNMARIYKKGMKDISEDNNTKEAWGVIVNAVLLIYLIFILAIKIWGY